MKTILDRLCTLVLARPRILVWVSILLCLLLSSAAFRVPLDFSFLSVLDTEQPLIKKYLRMSERLALSNRLFILIEGPDEKLDPAVAALKSALEQSPHVRNVATDLPRDWLEANGPWLVEDALFEDWVGMATHPEDREGARRLAEKLQALKARASPNRKPGALLMGVKLEADPLLVSVHETLAGTSPYWQVDSLVREQLEAHGVKGELAGLAAVGAQDQRKTLKKIKLLTPISLLLVLALLVFVEPNPLRLALVGVPMVLAAGATLGATGLILGKLTLSESFFGIMVFGLGVDYALHLLVRMREERARGSEFSDALRATMTGAGRGVVAGAATTAGTFAVLAFTPDPLVKHLGLSGALGLSMCLLLMLIFLPATWVLFSRKGRPTPAVELSIPLLSRLARWAGAHPRSTVIIALVVAGGALAGQYRYHFETDLTRIFNRDVPAIKAGERIQKMFGATISPWVIESETLEEARRVQRALEQEPTFTRVEGAASLFPSELEPRMKRLKEVLPQIRDRREALERMAAIAGPFAGNPFSALGKLLEILERAAEQGPPNHNEIPIALADQVRAPDGGWLTYAYSDFAGLDGVRFAEERRLAEAISPTATGVGGVVEGVLTGDRPWMLPTFGTVLALVALILALDLRDPRWILAALAPVLFGTTVTFGLLCWLDVGFNVMLLVVVPLLLGLGVDDGIHVVHRLRESKNLTLETAVASVGRAIVMTTLTTCVSFGVLMFADHRGFESISLTLLFSLPLCLLASVTLTPALVVFLGLRKVENSGGEGKVMPRLPL